MSDVKVQRGDWIVVADGAKALVLENIGTVLQPKLTTRETYQQPDPKTHELGTDAPGRAFSSVGNIRSAMEQTDWHEEAEQAFLKKLAERLHAAVLAGETKGLVVIAPPRALGILRRALSSNVRSILRGEIDKDYVTEPVQEIEKRLAG
jgi:protein required for attachment to host cells